MLICGKRQVFKKNIYKKTRPIRKMMIKMRRRQKIEKRLFFFHITRVVSIVLTIIFCSNNTYSQYDNSFLLSDDYVSSYVYDSDVLVDSLKGGDKLNKFTSFPMHLDNYKSYTLNKISSFITFIESSDSSNFTFHQTRECRLKKIYIDSNKQVRFSAEFYAQGTEVYRWYDKSNMIIKSVEVINGYFTEKIYHNESLIKQLVSYENHGFLTFFDEENRIVVNINYTRDDSRWFRKGVYNNYSENNIVELLI